MSEIKDFILDSIFPDCSYAINIINSYTDYELRLVKDYPPNNIDDLRDRVMDEIQWEIILSEYGINYIQQYKIPIDTTINIQGNTEIDFYLPEYNIFIEYNGIQHYIPQDYFGGKLKFEKYQIPRDNYVRNYCKDNNIRLIEVDYTYKTKQDIINYLNTNAKEIFIRQKLN